MANLGNAWHLPGNPEPRGNAGMRDPVFPTDPVPAVTVFSGNQFQGGGNPGNQLQDGSALLFKRTTDTGWQTVPLTFDTAIGNNKYYSGAIPTDAFPTGTVVQYYLRIAYDDHDTTFLHAAADEMTSMTTVDETAAQSAPFTFTFETPDRRGQWGEPFTLRNVGVHAHVLPGGLVLMWGRRDNPQQSLDTDPASPLGPGLPPAPPATCTPFLWNPANGDMTPTPPPALSDGTTNANLFCSGHAFLPDGRLLVAGGHLADSHGLNQATIYDSVANTWTPTEAMIHGRWYPTAITLPTGGILVLSGSFFDLTQTPSVANNVVPQVWSNGNFTNVTPIPDAAFDLYPRMHIASTGIVYMTSLVQTWSLDVSGVGTWTALPNVTRHNGLCDYAPSVLYDVDKVIFIGGGNPPTASAETIDLSQAQPAWQATDAAAQVLEAAQPEALVASAPTSARDAPKDAFALRAMVRDVARGTQVLVGIRGSCPYGIAACWGGANEALRSLEGVEYVDPIPDGERSTATVYLEDDRLPALDHWDDQFLRMVRQTYVLRGVEVTLNGTIEARDGVLLLASEGRRPPVELAPLAPGGKIQWDPAAASPQAAEPGEASAYNMLARSSGATDARRLTVTGPLQQTGAGYRLQVRMVEF